jgi:[ribosomal protein S5]-alanine N-acetyltransferase
MAEENRGRVGQLRGTRLLWNSSVITPVSSRKFSLRCFTEWPHKSLREPGRRRNRHNRHADSLTRILIVDDRTVTRAIEILTDRLRLRPPTLADAEQIFVRYGQDPEVSRYMSWIPHRSIEDTVAFLKRIVGDNLEGRSFGFLIFSRPSGELLGSVGGAIEKHRMQFGYCLARDAWGRGFATEAARAFVAAALKIPDLWRVQAFCDVENCASARVLEKSGLEREGTLRRYMVLPNLGNTPRDVYCYATIRAAAETLAS